MKALLFGSSAAILVAGAVAFAFSQDGRSTTTPERAPVAQKDTPAPAAELVPAAPIEEPVAQGEVALPPGYTVDEDGHVWEPLSFYKPQLKNNGDGTVTMRKLARIYEPDGSMREVPIKVLAHPVQKRVPVKQRTLPPHLQKQVDEKAAQQETEAAEPQDG